MNNNFETVKEWLINLNARHFRISKENTGKNPVFTFENKDNENLITIQNTLEKFSKAYELLEPGTYCIKARKDFANRSGSSQNQLFKNAENSEEKTGFEKISTSVAFSSNQEMLTELSKMNEMYKQVYEAKLKLIQEQAELNASQSPNNWLNQVNSTIQNIMNLVVLAKNPGMAVGMPLQTQPQPQPQMQNINQDQNSLKLENSLRILVNSHGNSIVDILDKLSKMPLEIQTQYINQLKGFL
jgi:hypothetical protein